MDEETIDVKIAALTESVRGLSTITANHNTLLTKIVDDHELRLRALEKCALTEIRVEKLEKTVRDIELHGSQPAEDALHSYELINKRVTDLELLSSNQKAVINWWDHAWVKISIIVGVALGVLGFVMDLIRWGAS
jgi:hypothetical protein